MAEADPIAPDLAAEQPRRRLPRWIVVCGIVLLLLVALLVSPQASVAPKGPPTAESVHAAREAAHQFAGRQSRLAIVRLDNRSLAGLASIAGDAAGIDRVEARVDRGTFFASASLPLPVAGWINGAVRFSGDQRGFPKVRASVGHIPIPGWASRRAAEFARWLLRRRGVALPPLDEMFQRVTVRQQDVIALVAMPPESGLVGGLIGIRGAQADGPAVAALYCKLVDLQRRDPDVSLAAQVRRAFINAQDSDPVARNQTAFIALAILIVGPRAEDLAPAADHPSRRCGAVGDLIRLEQRVDLAKHWSLSAALAATLGTDAARAMGEWKELDDSLPDGSGFSFVDLAADRSGVHLARLGSDPATAADLGKRMSEVTDHQLLPVAALAAQEGLSERQFLERYGTIRSDRYKDTVAWIDRILGAAD